MFLNPSRVAVALGLAAWAGLFWYLLISGKWTLYLAARVEWLVPVAAVCFTAGAVGLLLSARVDEPRALRPQEGRTLALMVAPVLLILLVPIGTLSDFAAGRRTSYSLAQFSESNPISAGQPLTFQQIVGAQGNSEGRAQLAERQGEEVELIGIVNEPTAEGFKLTRFVISCCVVDAAVAEVEVRGAPADLTPGSWVSVRGPLAVAEDRVAIERPQVEPSDPPDPPYLYP